MKTGTATANSNGSNLQTGPSTPIRLARVGVAALVMTAVSAGFLGAGSASADGPQRLGQTTTTQVTQTTQVTRIQPVGNTRLGNATTFRVTRVTSFPSGDGSATEDDCHNAQLNINSLLGASNYHASKGNWELSFDYAKAADTAKEDAQDSGCVVIS